MTTYFTFDDCFDEFSLSFKSSCVESLSEDYWSTEFYISLSFEFSLNYKKLATLPAKPYTRKNKINSAKYCLQWGYNPGPLSLCSNALLTKLS